MIKTYVASLEVQYLLHNQLVSNYLLMFFYFFDINYRNYLMCMKYIWIMICLQILYMIII